MKVVKWSLEIEDVVRWITGATPIELGIVNRQLEAVGSMLVVGEPLEVDDD